MSEQKERRTRSLTDEDLAAMKEIHVQAFKEAAPTLANAITDAMWSNTKTGLGGVLFDWIIKAMPGFVVGWLAAHGYWSAK